VSVDGDAELRALLALTRRLPNSRPSRAVARALRKLYLRRPRADVECDMEGARMRLAPSDYVEGQLLFGPQLYEGEERDFVRSHLAPGDTFLDLGSHVGCYALVAARAVGPIGRVLAVEANPRTYERLVANVGLSGADNVAAVHCGVSDRHETLGLHVRASKNTGASSFLVDVGDTVPVECRPLLDILEAHGVERVAGAKLDIEGLEYRVLDRFFADAAERPALWPRFAIIEQRDPWLPEAGGDVIALMEKQGYRRVWKSPHLPRRPNHILVRDGAG
jgi:FkbM family methyltransferase